MSQLLNETNDQSPFQLLDPSRSTIDDRPSRHTIPSSDIRQSSPGSQITQPHSAEAMFGLITSARSDKEWISTLHIAAQKSHENII
jgi:hypothetical protein